MNITLLLPLLLSAGLALILLAAFLLLRRLYGERRAALAARYASAARRTMAPEAETPAVAAVLRAAARPGPAGRRTDGPLRRARATLKALQGRDIAILLMIFVALFLSLAAGLKLPLLLSALLAGLVAMALSYAILRRRRSARLDKIAEAVPETLEAIVRSLRVGAPISKSLQMAAAAIDGPIAEEFARTSRAVSYGQDLVTAMHELAERCHNQDLRFFATAVEIQYQSGGNLAEVLERLTMICRGRQQLQRKVGAITSEAKWSGNFLSAFPIVAGVGIWLLNPDYFAVLYDTAIFAPLMIVVGILLIANLVFMRRMVNFRD